MRKETTQIQKWIKKSYQGKYKVHAEQLDGINRLPEIEDSVYQPDIVLRRKDSGEICYLIEIECNPVRKALVGASVLADYCMKELQQRRCRLVFVVYTPQGVKQMPNFHKRIELVKRYCRYLQEIEIYSIDEFKRLDL